MSTLIVPICGKSERYGLDRPKWTLRVGNTSMLEAATNGLIYDQVLYIHKSNESEYVYHNMSEDIFHDKAKFIRLNYQTKNQIDTIYAGIRDKKLTGPIMIKDCDNSFLPQQPYSGNFVAYSQLEGVVFNPEAKSYLQLNDHNEIVNVVEKKVISDKFCCGLYGFASADEFMDYSTGCEYVSQIVLKMLLAKKVFTGVKVADYKDYGTLQSYQYFTKD